MERAKEEYVWTRKIFFMPVEMKNGEGMKDSIWRRKISFYCGGEEKQRRKFEESNWRI